MIKRKKLDILDKLIILAVLLIVLGLTIKEILKCVQ